MTYQRLEAYAHELVTRVKWERPTWRRSLGTLIVQLGRREGLLPKHETWLRYRILDLHQGA